MEATRPGKRVAEDEADDSERMHRGTEGGGDVAACDHPGPIVESGEFSKGEMT